MNKKTHQDSARRSNQPYNRKVTDWVDTDFSMVDDENSDTPSERPSRHDESVVLDENWTAAPTGQDDLSEESSVFEAGLDSSPPNEPDARASGSSVVKKKS